MLRQVLIILTGLIFVQITAGQDLNNAERNSAYILIEDMEYDDFLDREFEFNELVAVYASRYCKRVSHYCWTSDKQIRHHDVIIANSSMAMDEDGVDVQLYIRDRFDQHEAALEKWQLAAVFDRYTDSIEDSFGYRVRVTDPIFSGLYGWEIALIVVFSVIAVVIIIVVSVVETNKKKKKKAATADGYDTYEAEIVQDVVGPNSAGYSVEPTLKYRPTSGDSFKKIGDEDPRPPVYEKVVVGDKSPDSHYATLSTAL